MARTTTTPKTSLWAMLTAMDMVLSCSIEWNATDDPLLSEAISEGTADLCLSNGFWRLDLVDLVDDAYDDAADRACVYAVHLACGGSLVEDEYRLV